MVLDLGSGSGTDVFCAAVQVGESGRVVGVDFTDEQIDEGHAAARSRRVRPGRVRRSNASMRCRSRTRLRCRDLERRDQPLADQAPRLRRNGARAAPGRTAGARRHRQRQAAEGAHPAQRRALGRLHRRRDSRAAAISRRSKPQVSGSKKRDATTTTSSPNAPSMPAAPTASRASPWLRARRRSTGTPPCQELSASRATARGGRDSLLPGAAGHPLAVDRPRSARHADARRAHTHAINGWRM